MKKPPANQFCHRTRRQFLHETGGGFGAVALAGLLAKDGFFPADVLASGGAGEESSYENPLAPKAPPRVAKAKNVIFLFMYGGPSQVDTFDYKPELYKLDDKTIQVKTFGRGGHKNEGVIVGPKWKFKQYGECGKWVSDVFPHQAQCVDDIAFIHSMTADSPIHGSAMVMMNSGNILSGNPSIGSWINYGLGSVNENLPGFLVMLDPTGGPIGGSRNWSSGYMPATYQGTVLQSKGPPILDLSLPAGTTPAMQRRLLDQLKMYNEQHQRGRTDNSNLAARINSYELAYKMQQHAPEAVDLAQETAATHALYGLNNPQTQDFGRKCLLARRLVERGVRFVQLYSGGAHNNDNWDAHEDVYANHSYHGARTDQPVAALIKDLKQRGMLDETLIIWGGEFGRQPTAEFKRQPGRDHNAYGFTMYMAGGGVKGGTSYGKTDELGAAAVEGKLHVRNLHATILHLMGLDPNHLTYFHDGLDKKLVGVEEAEPIHEILA